jgi:hypothetical protein
MDTPWQDQATLIRMTSEVGLDGQVSEILFEGPLLAMVRKVQEINPAGRKRLRIYLPDRHVRPFSFQDEMLLYLLDRAPQR